MNHADALAWLYGRQKLGIKLGLEKVHRLLGELGNPHREFQSVHVAGTNGKGSVVQWLDSAMRHAGHKVGRFTSPHLIRFNERIAVNGEEIPDADIGRLVERLMPFVKALDAEGENPTFFELVTALAFVWFQEQGVEWAIVEAGMGGRLDATNILTPQLTVITNVGMDHQQFLGDTIIDIAAEKAGIMKPGVPCVTAATHEPRIALKATAVALGCPMSIVGEDYQVAPDIGGMVLIHPGGTAHYDVAAAGEHQIVNAAIAVAVADALRIQGVPFPIPSMQQALANVTIPGRLETVDYGGVDVLLDGAHNLDGAVALRRHFAHRGAAGFQLIVGFSKDKPWQDMLAQWAPLAARVIGVPLRSGRSMDPEIMRADVEGIGIPFLVCPDAASALRQAKASAPTQIVVAGSLFLVGEARATLIGETLEEIRGDQ
jgi:dihydrofolate synthase/folylpolyglutamate synthase